MNKSDFIKKANDKWNERWDYCYVDYVDGKTEIDIKCKKHNIIFHQKPNNHLRSVGCKKCSTEARLSKRKKTTIQFIEEANKKHNFVYDYTETIYTKSVNKVKIKCKIHGIFLQIPYSHLSGHGCQKCAVLERAKEKIFSLEDFVNKANKIHESKYTYEKVKYKSLSEKVVIICPIHDEFSIRPYHHLSGVGCKSCALKKRATTKINNSKQKFEVKSREKHGNKYCYNKVEYIRHDLPVTITCSIHGDFIQTPTSHLSGRGCQKCAKKFMDLEYFIEKSREKHSNKYLYEKVFYNGVINNVIIICPIHGEFKQTPKSHLDGAGCRKCSGCEMDTKYFIEKSFECFPKNTFIYDKTIYIDAKTKIELKCVKCNKYFLQNPQSHLRGNNGCDKCYITNLSLSKTKSREKYIKDVTKVHADKYDYSSLEYNGCSSKVKIICKKHGVFKQIAGDHLSGSGCPQCSTSSGFSKQQLDYLKMMEFIYNNKIRTIESDEGEKKIGRYKVDGYMNYSGERHVFEYHGDFWHGNPKIYDGSEINAVIKKTMGELYNKTKTKEKFMIKKGYKLHVMWENDWNKLKHNILFMQKSIKHYVKYKTVKKFTRKLIIRPSELKDDIVKS